MKISKVLILVERIVDETSRVDPGHPPPESLPKLSEERGVQ